MLQTSPDKKVMACWDYFWWWTSKGPYQLPTALLLL